MTTSERSLATILFTDIVASTQRATELGDNDRARAAYEDVLVAWRNADPELRARIEAAREGLARLPKPLRREAS